MRKLTQSSGLTKDMSSLNKPNQPNEAKTRAPTKREQNLVTNELMESDNAKIGDFGFDKPLQKQVVEGNKLTKSNNAMIGQFSSSKVDDE